MCPFKVFELFVSSLLFYLFVLFVIDNRRLTFRKQILKNILVLQNWLERIRKEVTNKVLSIKRISEFLNFPILAQPTLKKI